jgi:hypothetical protein
MGRCPPGVFCIENVSILFLIIVILVVIYFIHIQGGIPKRSEININETITETRNNNNRNNNNGLFSLPSFSFSNVRDDILLNPYEAPLRDDRVYQNSGMGPPGVPINVQTQGYDANYRQIGILTRISGAEMILPLMGRPLITNRDKWNFYTMTSNNNMIKLPVSHKGKSCTSEYGCDNIYDGDSIYVEGYNDAFKATIYDNNVMRYIPYL